MLDRPDQNTVGEPSEPVVMCGHGFDEEVSSLVNQERLLRYVHTPLRFDGALNAVESGSVLYARPVIGRGYSAETAAPLFCQLVKRSVSGKRISGAFGGDQLHATEHGESQCDFICLQTGSYSA